MHGVFEENAGVFPSVFQSEDDYFDYLEKTAIFTAEREEGTYYFEPIRVKDYLTTKAIDAMSIDGQRVSLTPKDLTTRGTVEFRSVCTQPFYLTFAPAAFHLGLLVNLEKFEALLQETTFFDSYDYDFPAIRRRFSKKDLEKKELEQIVVLTKGLLECAEEGLKRRGFGEEIYLSPLYDKLDKLKLS